MRSITIKIANAVIETKIRYCRAYNMLKDFRVDDCPDICVEYSQSDIDEEMASHNNFITKTPSLIQLEIYVLLRKISEALLDYNAFLFHGATIGVKNYAYIFTAPSGTGKTTHICKWLMNCNDAYVINGDKPFVRIDDNNIPVACSSPWAGKENMYTKVDLPLKAIILMERSEDNQIEQISFSEAFPLLLQQVYRPKDEEKMRKTLKLMRCMSERVSFWRFRFNNNKEDCFQVAYDALIE